MCVANSARSQLAEGLARKLFPDADIQSAGSHPGTLNPYAVTVMKETGIDISQQYSKSIDDLTPWLSTGIDYVITLCAEEVCPIMISKAKQPHWPLSDPTSKEPLSDEEILKRLRVSRDAISERLERFKP